MLTAAVGSHRSELNEHSRLVHRGVGVGAVAQSTTRVPTRSDELPLWSLRNDDTNEATNDRDACGGSERVNRSCVRCSRCGDEYERVPVGVGEDADVVVRTRQDVVIERGCSWIEETLEVHGFLVCEGCAGAQVPGHMLHLVFVPALHPTWVSAAGVRAVHFCKRLLGVPQMARAGTDGENDALREVCRSAGR